MIRNFDPKHFKFAFRLNSFDGPRHETNATRKEDNEEYQIYFVRKREVVKLSSTSHFMNLLRFGFSNGEHFGKYFFLPEFYIFNEYLTFLSKTNSYLNLRTYDQPWPESSVAYFCKEILKGLNFLKQNELCYGNEGYNFCLNHVGDIKLNFHKTVQDSYLAFTNEKRGVLNIVFFSPDIIRYGRDKDASIKSDIYGLGIQAMILLENKMPKIYAKAATEAVYINKVLKEEDEAISLRYETKFKSVTRRFVSSAVKLKSSKRASLDDLMSHGFLELADSETYFKERFLPLLLKAQGLISFYNL